MSATLKLTGDASGAVKAVQDFNKVLDIAEKNADDAGKGAKRFVEAAKRVSESINPQEKYNAQLARLAELVQKGGLSIDAARIKAVQYEKALHKVEESSSGAFGAAAVSRLVAFTGGLGGIAAAFKHVEDRAQAAADKVLESLAVAGELQQLGPEASERGAINARKLRNAGVADLTKGFEIAQNLENSGFGPKDVDYLIERVAKTRIVSADNLTEVGGALAKFQNAFGADETGSLPELIDKALYVSTIPGVQTGLRDTVIESLKFADSFKKFGSTDEQALAAFAAVERVSPSAENAAEVLKSFGAQVNARGLGRGNFEDTLANVKGLVDKAGGNAAKVLGDANAVAGYDRLIANEDFIREQAAKIGKASGTLDANAGILNKDPIMGAANARSIEEGRLAGDVERLETRRENLYDAVLAAHESRDVREGTWAVQRWFNYGADKVNDFFNGEEWVLRNARNVEEANPGTFSPETLIQIENYFKDQKTLLEKIESNTSRNADEAQNIRKNQRGRALTRDGSS